MDIKKILAFLSQHSNVAFATSENNKPKIRVFQIMKIDDTSLFFATAAHKEVYTQLKINPCVELLSMYENISIRIEGEVIFDVNESIGEEIFNANEILQKLYSDYKAMEYLRFEIRHTSYFDLSSNPPLFIKCNL